MDSIQDLQIHTNIVNEHETCISLVEDLVPS